MKMNEVEKAPAGGREWMCPPPVGGVVRARCSVGRVGVCRAGGVRNVIFLRGEKEASCEGVKKREGPPLHCLLSPNLP
jgi:hypothetical protein